MNPKVFCITSFRTINATLIAIYLYLNMPVSASFALANSQVKTPKHGGGSATIVASATAIKDSEIENVRLKSLLVAMVDNQQLLIFLQGGDSYNVTKKPFVMYKTAPSNSRSEEDFLSYPISHNQGWSTFGNSVGFFGINEGKSFHKAFTLPKDDADKGPKNIVSISSQSLWVAGQKNLRIFKLQKEQFEESELPYPATFKLGTKERILGAGQNENQEFWLATNQSFYYGRTKTDEKGNMMVQYLPPRPLLFQGTKGKIISIAGKIQQNGSSHGPVLLLSSEALYWLELKTQ